jgi:FkbM family methyltransferase
MQTAMLQFPSIRLQVGSLPDFKRRKAAVKEPETVDWLRSGLGSHGPFTLLDIGANVGGYSLIACTLDARCRAVAVEPFPPTFLTLCKNIAINGMGDRIVPLNAMVGVGVADACIPLRFDAWTSGVAEHANTGRFELQLPAVGSAVLAKHLGSAQVVLCKIDVDGAEVHVLDALPELLADTRLKSLLIECERDLRGAVETRLQSAGLQVDAQYGKANQHQVNLIAHRRG